jgi:hypothetical protein
MTHYKKLPSYFLHGAHQFRLTKNTCRSPTGRDCGATIIISHAPCLQGETFTGLSQRQRKFSNVASAHHNPCFLGVTCRNRLGGGRNPILDGPDSTTA